MLEGTPTGKGYIHKIKCPKHCGWYRDYTNRPEWMVRKIDHPIYGSVTEETLVQLEILDHDCIETANARLRHNRRVIENGQD